MGKFLKALHAKKIVETLEKVDKLTSAVSLAQAKSIVEAKLIILGIVTPIPAHHDHNRPYGNMPALFMSKIPLV